jgi:hypothetical protein
MSDADFTRKTYDVFEGKRLVDSAPFCYQHLKKGHLYLFTHGPPCAARLGR